MLGFPIRLSATEIINLALHRAAADMLEEDAKAAIGFHGPSSLMEVFTGRYNALPWFAEGEERKYLKANRGE